MHILSFMSWPEDVEAPHSTDSSFGGCCLTVSKHQQFSLVFLLWKAYNLILVGGLEHFYFFPMNTIVISTINHRIQPQK